MTILILLAPPIISGIAAILALRDIVAQEHKLNLWLGSGHTLGDLVAVLEKARRDGGDSVAREVGALGEFLDRSHPPKASESRSQG